jgi:DNA-binding transcriptional regulator YdaS (Cro superfamily)
MQIRELQKICGFKSYSQFWCVVTGRSRATAEVAVKIAAATGIPKSTIRPDLWPPRKSRRSDPAA